MTVPAELTTAVPFTLNPATESTGPEKCVVAILIYLLNSKVAYPCRPLGSHY